MDVRMRLGYIFEVELKGGNAKKAWFRILPRYKVKSEGDMVEPKDQFVLESVKNPGQYLHCSQFCFNPPSVYSSWYVVIQH